MTDYKELIKRLGKGIKHNRLIGTINFTQHYVSNLESAAAIEELEASLAQSIQSQTTAERNASTTLKVFYTSIHEVVPREYWKPLDDYMIKNAVKEDT